MTTLTSFSPSALSSMAEAFALLLGALMAAWVHAVEYTRSHKEEAIPRDPK